MRRLFSFLSSWRFDAGDFLVFVAIAMLLTCTLGPVVSVWIDDRPAQKPNFLTDPWFLQSLEKAKTEAVEQKGVMPSKDGVPLIVPADKN